MFIFKSKYLNTSQGAIGFIKKRTFQSNCTEMFKGEWNALLMVNYKQKVYIASFASSLTVKRIRHKNKFFYSFL